MNILQLVEKHMGTHKHFDGKHEIRVDECPFCGRKEKKFFINTLNGMFICHHGNCAEKGHVNKLYKKYNEESVYHKRKVKKKKYDKNKILGLTEQERAEFKAIGSKIKEYLTARGIDHTKIPKGLLAEYRGALAFPYKYQDKLKMMKYTSITEKVFWQQEGGTPVLWNLDNCDTSRPLYITEGEMCMLSDIQIGFTNVSSLPFGAGNTDWIDVCWDKLQRFPEFILAFDGDEAGQKAIQEISRRLGIEKCKTVDFGKYKDHNEVLINEGADKLKSILENKKEIKINGIFYGEEMETGFNNIERMRSGLREYDRCSGGIRLGELTVWSGFTGAGKSTILNQIKLAALEQGYKIGVYSRELPQKQYMNNLGVSACSPEMINMVYDDFKEKDLPIVKKDIMNKIKKWLGRDFVFMEGETNFTDKEIIDYMEIIYKRDGVKVFFIDNLMKIKLSKENGKWETQADFVDKLVNFAQYYGVHIHLVAHPKKPDGGGNVSTYDVAGAAEIVNTAHNVVFIQKIDGKQQEKIFETTGERPNGVLTMKKNRFDGDTDRPLFLKFDYDSKRLYSEEKERLRVYSWNNVKYDNTDEEEAEILKMLDVFN